jgi:hypothetical protein
MPDAEEGTKGQSAGAVGGGEIASSELHQVNALSIPEREERVKSRIGGILRSLPPDAHSVDRLAVGLLVEAHVILP